MADQDWQSRLKAGRNDDCPCGSGKKYKKCHLRADEEAQSASMAKTLEASKASGEHDEHDGHDHSGHDHHSHEHHHHGPSGHSPKPGSPVVRQVSAPRKAGGGS